MTEIQPITTGLHARSEALVQATRDHDRDRIPDEELDEAQRRDTEDLIGVQVAAGFPQLSTGQLTWQDLFRPFAGLIEGLETEVLTRFKDTNTFYRRPDLADDFTFKPEALGQVLDEHVPTTGPLPSVVTLPSPTAFVTGASDEDGTYPDAGIATRLAGEVHPRLIDALIDRGTATIVLADPWLSELEDPAPVLEAIGELASSTDGADLLIQLPFQDAGALVDPVLTTGVDGLIVDLTLTDREALESVPAGTTLGLGLIDARSSIVEREDLVAATLLSIADEVEADTLLVTHTGDLQHVPETIARKKVRTIGAAARTAAAKLGGGA